MSENDAGFNAKPWGGGANGVQVAGQQIKTATPVLIAGPTASGKSALALRIAQAQGGTVVNADALQVYDCWRVLTARPDATDLAAAPHALYGHIGFDAHYSVGRWLAEVAQIIESGIRPIVVGGTGLYFRALTEGLANIPPVPADVRATAENQLNALGLRAMAAQLDPRTRDGIDCQNPKRVMRAWEVLNATGRGLADWQAETPAPLIAADASHCFVLEAPPDVLSPRIERRFDQMLAEGALDEARAMLAFWRADLPAAQAIGAPELVAHLRGELSLSEARTLAIVATRQYAKRQRTWFRRRMQDWTALPVE